MKIKAVAFDMDGLIFDTEDLYMKAAITLLARRDKVYTQEHDKAVLGRPPSTVYKVIKETFGLSETWQELQSECESLFLGLLDEGYATMPGLYELLEYLEQRNIPKGICTSSALHVATEVLGRKDMAKRFDFVLTSDDVINGKPDPEIYQKAAAKFGIASSEMLVLEDSPAGCQAANTAGAFAVAVRVKHNAHFAFPDAKTIVPVLNAPEVLALF
ncbi:MAG: HAD family phosphatase [Planctomycetaceae bacterium]|nr:HAD family phosphatase [Planctomycetaceae bacterium]